MQGHWRYSCRIILFSNFTLSRTRSNVSVLPLSLRRGASRTNKMSHKVRGLSVCPGTALSVLSLLLYSAGFIRIEINSNSYDDRLIVVENAVLGLKQLHKEVTSPSEDTAQTTPVDAARRLKRSVSQTGSSGNDTTYVREIFEDMLATSLKICHLGGSRKICPPGRPGPPGRTGPKGDKGDQGRRGKKGLRGMMGQPGRSGKQGIMGPPGFKGEKGSKGVIGPAGMQGRKGEPGESISPPTAMIALPKLTINEGHTASLPCSASGNPKAQISWSKVNGSLPSKRMKSNSDGLIEILKVQLRDAGKYKCTARNILGTDEQVGELIVQSPPKILLVSGPSYVGLGDNVTLPKCRVTSFPVSTITWIKVFGRLPQKLSATKDGTLAIFNARKMDSGLYQCKASNKIGTADAVTQLVVVDLPKFTVKPPQKVAVKINSNTNIRCQADGDPKPTVSWIKQGGQLPVGRTEVRSDGTLIIRKFKKEDSGNYTCIASSALSKSFHTTELHVQEACAPVGVADRAKIPDSKMTSNSIDHSDVKPYYARFSETRGSRIWCGKQNVATYLQVDLGVAYFLCAVATEGNGGSSDIVTSYKLKLSTDAVSWQTYKEQNVEKVFHGNTERNKNSLKTHPEARFVRFYPITYNRFPCVRVEIFALI